MAAQHREQKAKIAKNKIRKTNIKENIDRMKNQTNMHKEYEITNHGSLFCGTHTELYGILSKKSKSVDRKKKTKVNINCIVMECV
jgi:hypothetical protein